MRLVAATGNPNKLREFRRILAPLGIEVLSPREMGAAADAEETGATFAENARIKARALFEQVGLPVVADDSGLCVDALGGRPGVLSARYQGEDATYGEKMAALLEEMKGVPREKRTARFVCAIHCILDENTALDCEGTCEGEIGFAPSGDGGFGYDPLFLADGVSFASLPGEKKDALSHRGRALRRLAGLLGEFSHVRRLPRSGEPDGIK